MTLRLQAITLHMGSKLSFPRDTSTRRVASKSRLASRPNLEWFQHFKLETFNMNTTQRLWEFERKKQIDAFFMLIQRTGSKIGCSHFHPVQQYQAHGHHDYFGSSQGIPSVVTTNGHWAVVTTIHSWVGRLVYFPPLPKLFDQIRMDKEPFVLTQPVQQLMR